MKSILFIISILLGSLWAVFNDAPKPTPPIETDIALGEKLFFDKILSLDNSIACASCHKPEFAFADTAVFSVGINGQLGTRNTPSVMNMALRPFFMYDGRAMTLEEQALLPIENPIEMHLDYDMAVDRVQANKTYQELFKKIYNSEPDSATILQALAAFQNSLESNGSAPNDQWLGEVEDAMTPSQIRGRKVFREEALCFDCHFGTDFTGDEFRNVGLYDGETLTDRGRFEITKDSTDLGKFKVPGLRNIALTAPYMHNGQFKTLEEVVDFYDDPYQFVKNPINMDSLMLKPLGLSDQQKTDLINFLHALTDETFPYSTTQK